LARPAPIALRLRVAGLVLAARRGARDTCLTPPAVYRPFLARNGADILLDLTDEPVPRPPRSAMLFSSGGLWRVYRFGDGLLYQFRSPACDPELYKGVSLDSARTQGRLYFPPQRGRGPRFALDYPLDELLFQHRLAQDGDLEVHACGLVADGRAVLFCGHSGAGKSTTARIWRRARPRTLILNDDRIVIRRVREGFRAWGTPWHGEGGYASNASRTLGAVFFLQQAQETGTTRLAPAEAAGRLLALTFFPPWESESVARAMETCGEIGTRVPCFSLRSRPDRSALDAVRAALRAES
jgi:hypothetical protein